MASNRVVGSSALASPARYGAPLRAPSPRERDEQERCRRKAQRQQVLERRKAEQKRLEKLARQQSRALSFKRLLTVCYIAVIFAMIVPVVMGFSKVSTLKMQNNQLQNQIEQQNTQIADLNLTLTSKTDLSAVSAAAKTRLGMDYPKTYQILSITLGQNQNTASATTP